MFSIMHTGYQNILFIHFTMFTRSYSRCPLVEGISFGNQDLITALTTQLLHEYDTNKQTQLYSWDRVRFENRCLCISITIVNALTESKHTPGGKRRMTTHRRSPHPSVCVRYYNSKVSTKIRDCNGCFNMHITASRKQSSAPQVWRTFACSPRSRGALS